MRLSGEHWLWLEDAFLFEFCCVTIRELLWITHGDLGIRVYGEKQYYLYSMVQLIHPLQCELKIFT